jgi:hypothetical protein
MLVPAFATSRLAGVSQAFGLLQEFRAAKERGGLTT